MAQDEWRGVRLSLLVLVLLGTFSLDCVRSRRLPLATVGGRSMLHSGEGGGIMELAGPYTCQVSMPGEFRRKESGPGHTQCLSSGQYSQSHTLTERCTTLVYT